MSPGMKDQLITEAKMLEDAGAALLDFTNSGPVVGPEVAAAVSIPVIGGFGGGPWLDGRVRLGHAAIGYGVKYLDENIDTYANVAPLILDAITAFSNDVRAARQIKALPLSRVERDAMPTATVDGIQTHYEVIGDGPPLLMYSPGGFDATLDKWSTLGIYARTRLLDHLAEKYRCITFDRRETGQSGGRVERITWDDYVVQGKGLLEHLGIQAAHV